MATEIVVPALGESVTTATVARWIKQQGETVAADEPLVELETDKVTVEVNAPSAGVLSSIGVPEGTEVEVGAVRMAVPDVSKHCGIACVAVHEKIAEEYVACSWAILNDGEVAVLANVVRDQII